MGWGALMGLGQGLQQVGGVITDNNKVKLASKLDAEKEERAAARAEKVRQQQLLEPDPSRTKYEMRNGALYEVIPNKSGGEYEAKLASQDKIDEFNFKKNKDSISLEAATLGLTKSKKDLEGYDEDKALEREFKRSQIEENRNTGQAAIMRAAGAGRSADASAEPLTTMEAAGQLVSQYSTLTTEARNAGVSQGDIEKLAESVMKEAKTPDDARRRFRDTLTILTRNAKASSE
jgi:hypothetical protein